MTEINTSTNLIYHDKINQIEKSELAIGGPDGNINIASKQLAENIEYVKVTTEQSFAEHQKQINSVASGHHAYKTYAEMQAAAALPAEDPLKLPANVTVDVVADTAGLNKQYLYDGTNFIPSPHDTVTQAKSYTDAATAKAVKGVVGKNLFDSREVESNKALNDEGATFNASNRAVSSFVTIQPDKAYSFTDINKAAFFDANRLFIQTNTGANANVTSPANAMFVRVDIDSNKVNSAQIEMSVNKTNYEPYKIVLDSSSVGTSQLQSDSVDSSKLKVQSVGAKHFKDAIFLNMHNASDLRPKLTISLSDGKTETISTVHDITEYIPCESNAVYSVNDMSRVLFYRADGSYISASADKTFTTPVGCTQLRFNLSVNTSFRFQLNAGATLPAVVPQPYKFSLPQLHVEPLSKIEILKQAARKYNLADAWYAWRNGDKFPVTFLGDSTTNGNGTTGFSYRATEASLGEDYIAPNAYATVFEQLIRSATGNTQMRAYNAGFSGRNSSWALANISDIMSGVYADSKMIGISHGINDRTANAALYAKNFYREIEGLIKWCIDNGYQPFLMTTQPTTIPKYIGDGDGSDIVEVANEIKKVLADKYALELIDVNSFAEEYMKYSSKPLLDSIMEPGGNVIHFGDAGHAYTAELLFAHFCKRTLWVDSPNARLDYATQLLKSDINHSDVSQLATFKYGFKNQVLTTQDAATNRLYQEFYIFITGKSQTNLTAYYADAPVGQYVLINGVQTTITEQAQQLGVLDLGLHKIQAYSSATTALDWLGFKLNKAI